MIILELNRIYQGNCLDLMPLISDKSIDLIIIDPPYNIGKAEWDKIKNYIEWMGKVFLELQRVLKDNGSFYFFHNDFLQIVELQNWINKNTKFVFKQLITINKPKFKTYAWKMRTEKCYDRNWFPNIEYCLFYTFQDETGSNQAAQNAVRDYLRNELNKYGIAQDIDKLFWKNGWANKGSNIASHFFGENNQNCLPTLENYKRLQKTGFFNKSYESLRQEYESLRYKFNKSDNLSCVWEWDGYNNGKYHPTEKPINTIKKIVEHSSNKNDTILDCFIGSGTTAIACMQTNRNFIGIELEPKYVEIANNRIANFSKQETLC